MIKKKERKTMAKNWTMAEAAKAVKENDMVAIADLGKRFPLMMHLLNKGIAGDGEAVVELFGAIPEYLTANKVNTAIKNVVGDGDVEEDEEEEAVEESKKKADKPAKKAAKEADDADDEADDYDSMTGNELVALCKERGIWSKLKDKKKAGMIAGLRAADANGDVAEDDDVEDEDGDEYLEMSPQELFKECKKRGLKPEMKKPAKYYIEMLKKDDMAADDADAEDDDWEDDEEEEEKKTPKKSDKKSAKKAKKEVEDDDDDDEDWDI